MEEKKRRETKTHQEAFELYAKLKLNNEKDVPEKVGKQFNRKVRTIHQWSSDFNWKERLRAVEQKAAQEANEKMIRKIAKGKEESLEFLLKYRSKLEREMLSNLLESPTPKDYTEIIKAIQLLSGEATARTESTNKIELPEDVKDQVKNLEGTIGEYFKEEDEEGEE